MSKPFVSKCPRTILKTHTDQTPWEGKTHPTEAQNQCNKTSSNMGSTREGKTRETQKQLEEVNRHGAKELKHTWMELERAAKDQELWMTVTVNRKKKTLLNSYSLFGLCADWPGLTFNSRPLLSQSSSGWVSLCVSLKQNQFYYTNCHFIAQGSIMKTLWNCIYYWMWT